MPEYEFRTTQDDSIEIEDGLDVIAADYNPQSRGRSWVFVEVPSSEGVEPTCAGNDGECSRSVENPGDRCWQHSEDDA